MTSLWRDEIQCIQERSAELQIPRLRFRDDKGKGDGP
jgi:hypothetical protein